MPAPRPNGRAWRKLARNRLALASALVVAIYLAVATLGFTGVITREATQQRVLPDKTPGSLVTPPLAKRIDSTLWLIERVESAVALARRTADRGDADGARLALADAALAERRIADEPLERLEEMVDEALAVLGELDEALVVFEELRDLPVVNASRINALRGREDAAGRVARLEAEIADARARLPEATADLEAIHARAEDHARRLMPLPTGADGLAYAVRTALGSDSRGASIMLKALFSTKIAFQIGFVVAVACVVIGTVLGAAAAFYGGWIDYAVMYLVSVLSSVPSLVLLGVLVYMFFGHPLFDNPAEHPGYALVPVYAAMGLTYWVGTCRVIRGEVMKIKSLEYVQAATTLGFGRLYILFRHVIPNTAHLMFINFALLFIGAIKSEVILSFLGLGVKGQPSWGIMIAQGKDDVIARFFWEVGAASVFMFGLVLAFNVLTDALQDAFDPRHVD